MNLRSCTLAAATAAAALLTTVPSASAAVRPGELPAVGEVANLYPALEGGSREVFRGRDVATPTRDCLAYRTTVRSSSGRWAGYLDADGDAIYFEGKADPTVFVHEFASAREASAALRTVRRHYSRCEGRFADSDGSRARTEIGVPAMGRDRYAFRTRAEDFGVASVDHFVDVYVVSGRRLVSVRVQADGFAPGKRKVVRLMGLALDRAL